jgi:hypothetical protein
VSSARSGLEESNRLFYFSTGYKGSARDALSSLESLILKFEDNILKLQKILKKMRTYR